MNENTVEKMLNNCDFIEKFSLIRLHLKVIWFQHLIFFSVAFVRASNSLIIKVCLIFFFVRKDFLFCLFVDDVIDSSAWQHSILVKLYDFHRMRKRSDYKKKKERKLKEEKLLIRISDIHNQWYCLNYYLIGKDTQSQFT